MNTSTRRLIRLPVFWLLCLLGAAHAQSGPVLDRIRAEGSIVLAHRESSVPFCLDAQGQPVGYALDLCRRLAAAVQQKLGMDKLAVRYLQVSPANRIDMVAQGKAHMECGSTTNNASRRE